MVDLNLAYLLKGEHLNTSSTQLGGICFVVFFFPMMQNLCLHEYFSCMWKRGLVVWFFCLLGDFCILWGFFLNS